jgi:uncharacterized membrane protein
VVNVSPARILRHLATGRFRLRRAFPPPTLKAIEQAIREAETGHEGEIVFVVEGALDTMPLLHGQTARQRAIEVFSRLRIWDTEQNNGVLLYVLLADRDVEIVADRGIDARAGDQTWSDICREMEASFGRGDYHAGSLAGIHAVGEHLRRHFASSGKRRNELPDEPIVS